MKVLSTFTLSRQQTFDKVKRFYEIDKSRTSREGRQTRDAQLSLEQKSQLKGVLRSIKLVNKYVNNKVSEKKSNRKWSIN
jgi:hypothetical protein